MSTSSRTRLGNDDFPATGSMRPAPDFLINHELPEIGPEDDSLLADINVLMAQNPGRCKFRAPDLKSLNHKAKRQLLIDMQEALGIKPLKQLMP